MIRAVQAQYWGTVSEFNISCKSFYTVPAWNLGCCRTLQPEPTVYTWHGCPHKLKITKLNKSQCIHTVPPGLLKVSKFSFVNRCMMTFWHLEFKVVVAFLLCRYNKYFKYRMAKYLNSSSEFSYLNNNYLAKQKTSHHKYQQDER